MHTVAKGSKRKKSNSITPDKNASPALSKRQKKKAKSKALKEEAKMAKNSKLCKDFFLKKSPPKDNDGN